MKHSVTVQTEHYRGYQIETRDARGEGWIVRIASWEGVAPGGTILRSASPHGLAVLLGEARELIDAALAMSGSGLSSVG